MGIVRLYSCLKEKEGDMYMRRIYVIYAVRFVKIEKI